jgi:integrase
MYAGLRAGELLALDWSAVDLAGGLIRVERAYDSRARA